MNLWLSSNVSVVVILRRFNLLGNHKKQDYYFIFVEVFVKPDSKRAERVFRCFHDDIFLRMTCRPIRFLYFPTIFLSKTCQPERPARPVCQSGVCRGKQGPDRCRMPVVFSRSGGVPEIRYKWALPCRDGGFRNLKKQLKSMGQTNRAAGFTKILF